MHSDIFGESLEEAFNIFRAYFHFWLSTCDVFSISGEKAAPSHRCKVVLLII